MCPLVYHCSARSGGLECLLVLHAAVRAETLTGLPCVWEAQMCPQMQESWCAAKRLEMPTCIGALSCCLSGNWWYFYVWGIGHSWGVLDGPTVHVLHNCFLVHLKERQDFEEEFVVCLSLVRPWRFRISFVVHHRLLQTCVHTLETRARLP